MLLFHRHEEEKFFIILKTFFSFLQTIMSLSNVSNVFVCNIYIFSFFLFLCLTLAKAYLFLFCLYLRNSLSLSYLKLFFCNSLLDHFINYVWLSFFAKINRSSRLTFSLFPSFSFLFCFNFLLVFTFLFLFFFLSIFSFNQLNHLKRIFFGMRFCRY